MRLIIIIAFSLFMMLTNFPAYAGCSQIFDSEMRELHSPKLIKLCELVGENPALVVNTASHCGFTPQFKALEALHQQYKSLGLVVIGFASNDFFQEVEDEAKSATICYENYGVSFTMLAPSKVKGKHANAVFKQINQQSQQPKWNFNKYVIDKNGKVIAHFGSRTKPDNKKLLNTIKQVL